MRLLFADVVAKGLGRVRTLQSDAPVSETKGGGEARGCKSWLLKVPALVKSIFFSTFLENVRII